MYRLWATILKDTRILTRDRIGLIFMFGMPVLLVLIMTSIQNNTFELVNKDKTPLLICNRDTGKISAELIAAIDKLDLFRMIPVPKNQPEKEITSRMRSKEALLAIIIPADFSFQVMAKAKQLNGKALNSFGLAGDTLAAAPGDVDPLTLYYHPVLQPSFRLSIQGALGSALQLVESRQVLRLLYFSINEKQLPAALEKDMLGNGTAIDQIPVLRDDSKRVPNASEHNVPAWTVFAMFFVVLSLSASIVREKSNGSLIRLKTLPTHYGVALLSKQIIYLVVTLIQATIIFAIGIWVFPHMGLPVLALPRDISGLVIVSLLCGWCAVSYAICIGVFAETPVQANSFGAISIVLLAAIGGLMVPGFAMPASFQTVMKISPLHWCLEAYYGLFLEGGKLRDILTNIIPLLGLTVLIQLITFWGLKRKRLI
jgi:ABC-2 type transport system permease protein